MNLKKQVKKMLIEKEMTMRDFAKELNISYSYLSYILNDKRKASYYRDLIKINVDKYNKKRTWWGQVQNLRNKNKRLISKCLNT